MKKIELASKYVPKKGDIVWLNFDPQSGHEQAGKRPALIISPLKYNEKSRLAFVCPITNQKKGYPFEVDLLKTKTTGVVLSDQLKALDWSARKAELIETCPKEILSAVLEKIQAILEG